MAATMKSLRAAGSSVAAPRVARRSAVKVQAVAASDRYATTLEYAKSLPGISAPFPDLFDPANFLATASVKDVRRWRESEIVHGRVSMLAALGFIVQEQLEDFSLFDNADGHIQGPAIYQFQQVEARGAVFWEPLVFAIGLVESYRVGLGWAVPKGADFNSLKEDYNMGELGFDPLGLTPADPEEYKTLQTKELNNGRLAMIAIAAFVAQELVERAEIFEHLFVGVEKEIVAEEVTVEKEIGIL